MNGKDTPLKDGDEVSIIPAISGGFLSNEEIERYSRQIILPEVGGKGQKKLLNSSVLVVGAGGLGSPALLYLAAAGIGKIGVVDSDMVEISNLQRQVLHFTQDIGKPKTTSAKEKLKEINPHVDVEGFPVRITSENALKIISPFDVVVDSSDNFATRYLINDACVLLKKPLVEAAILRFEGQIMTIVPGKSACYRCLFPEPPPPGSVPTCQQAGVMGPIAGIMGCLQAIEVIKLILGEGELFTGKLQIIDLLNNVFHQVKVHRDPSCAVCGDNATINALFDYEEWCLRRG